MDGAETVFLDFPFQRAWDFIGIWFVTITEKKVTEFIVGHYPKHIRKVFFLNT